jgi:dTDP-4-dehydrorhamnose 3,5-epimerase/CDP-3, 6-dideoxy-D-glycero-D-glycero-4-hexulose-5-epimerase
MKDIRELPLPGAYLLTLPYSEDARGSFIKTFHETTLTERNIHFTIKESYFSISKKDVIRGMHFQLPPAQHSKIVFCPLGAIMDVIVDMRKDSPTFREHFSYELSGNNNMAFFIPEGFAHGFKTLTDDAMTYYLVSSEYNKDCDTGILYDSIGFDWNIKDPIISARDLSFVKMAEFDSPFRM